MQAGRMRDIVQFVTEAKTADGMGGSTVSTIPKVRTRGRFEVRRGREIVESDRTIAVMSGVLTIRYNALTANITEDDHVIINGVQYQIRSIAQPDRRNRRLEMVIDRGRVI